MLEKNDEIPMKKTNIIFPDSLKPSSAIKKLIQDFIKGFSIYEIKNGSCLVLNFDKKSNTYYLICHLNSSELSNNADLEATLEKDDEEDAIYKLNREITEDESAFIAMQSDSENGRSFEDMVIEYDKSYRPTKPLKVYGGQHRIRAISNSLDHNKDIYHGVRVYFNLDKNQKVEIATINNTSIAVSNDLLDRMREQLLGTELREWCQKVGLLDKDQDFSDRKSPEVPTVRIVRTLLINFHLGTNMQLENFHQPIIAKSGGIDEKYLEIRKVIDWGNEKLLKMGKEFATLHKVQRKTVIERNEDNLSEFSRKVLSLAVVSSWSYASGLFQNYPDLLNVLYNLPN